MVLYILFNILINTDGPKPCREEEEELVKETCGYLCLVGLCLYPNILKLHIARYIIKNVTFLCCSNS